MSYKRFIFMFTRLTFSFLLFLSACDCKQEPSNPMKETSIQDEQEAVDFERCVDGKLVRKKGDDWETCVRPERTVFRHTLKNDQIFEVNLQSEIIQGSHTFHDTIIVKYKGKKVFSRSYLDLPVSIRYDETEHFRNGSYDVFVVITNTQGAHCCSVVDTITLDPKDKLSISNIPTPDHISFADMDNDGFIDAIAGNYLDYFHQSHADSADASIFFRFKNGRFVQDKKAFSKIYEGMAESHKSNIKSNNPSIENLNSVISAAFYYIYIGKENLAKALIYKYGKEIERDSINPTQLFKELRELVKEI
ncbi:hypothetical protein EHO59_15005 [Leptospira semungkisensis]|uniref:Lipoprotein n=1 Tax=Leptospira semungkisensis TaxID=2484985 RepID=A0A4R9FKN6_9LEPT|nr:hypothetical protein [Leptospira semungkisensis]TGJ99185.1 hypothetical protein EHO59_15005 [Leptospira semungkisensis]